MSFNNWSAIAANVKPACRQIVTKTTLQIRDNVQTEAPVRSGFMRDAAYAVTPDGGSTYGEATPPTDDVYLLDEVTPEDDMTGIVGAAANYSIFVNDGTRFQSPNPWFDRGVEAGRGQFEENLGEFESLLGGG